MPFPPPQPRNERLSRKARPRGRSVTGERRVQERDKIRMCLDAAPRVISVFSSSQLAVSAAEGRVLATRATPGTPEQPPPGADTERPSWPVRSPGWVHRHPITSCPGSPAPPRAELEPKEPERENAERETEKGVGVRMHVCAWGGGRPDHL